MDKVKVIWLRDKDFFKCQKGIERSNVEKPVPKMLVMVLDDLDPQSPRAGILLKEYYLKQEKDPDYGLGSTELSLVIKNTLDSEGNFTCAYCEKEHPASEATIDHYKPLMFRGKNLLFNLKISCRTCNTMKGAIHPARMPNVFNLFKQKVLEGKHSSCLKVLREAKDTIMNMDDVENKLMKKLIITELYWREQSGKLTEDTQDDKVRVPELIEA